MGVAYHADRFFTELEEAAKTQNGWRLIAAIQTHPGGDGFVPHGVAIIKRPGDAARDEHRGAGREFGVLNCYVGPGYAGFETGDYDLTIEDALEEFTRRIGSGRPFASQEVPA